MQQNRSEVSTLDHRGECLDQPLFVQSRKPLPQNEQELHDFTNRVLKTLPTKDYKL